VSYTRPSGAGSKTPATSATPVSLAADASPEQNGPSSGSAAARRSQPNLTCVASGNTARSAPWSAAWTRANLTRLELTSGRELTGIWPNAIRILAA
jgi:hypothetical protein